MNNDQKSNFYNLNRENAWLEFRHIGLENRPDGAIQLATLPFLPNPPSAVAQSGTKLNDPAGIAIGDDGTVYFSHPDRHLLMKIDACEGSIEPVACIGGEGSSPDRMQFPRGLAYHRPLKALLIADSGNARIQVVDPTSWQIKDIWHLVENTNSSMQFKKPGSLAADPHGNVYVVDQTLKRIARLDLFGRPIPSFWQTARHTVTAPVAVVVGMYDDRTLVFVLDAEDNKVILLSETGEYITGFGADVLQNPLVLAIGENTVLVGDNQPGRILAFKLKGAITNLEIEFAGAAFGYKGPVAALAADSKGGLWLHNGGTSAPLRLDINGAYRQSGVLWGGPFGPGGRSVNWHRMRADLLDQKENSHIFFLTL